MKHAGVSFSFLLETPIIAQSFTPCTLFTIFSIFGAHTLCPSLTIKPYFLPSLATLSKILYPSKKLSVSF